MVKIAWVPRTRGKTRGGEQRLPAADCSHRLAAAGLAAWAAVDQADAGLWRDPWSCESLATRRGSSWPWRVPDVLRRDQVVGVTILLQRQPDRLRIHAL